MEPKMLEVLAWLDKESAESAAVAEQVRDGHWLLQLTEDNRQRYTANMARSAALAEAAEQLSLGLQACGVQVPSGPFRPREDKA